jgi:hypothetical protein
MTAQKISPEDIVLRRTSPGGRPNPYRTRWATVDGQTFVVEADNLNGPWCVADETAERFADDPEGHLALLESGKYRNAWVFTLAEARQQIADWLNDEGSVTP